jgi:hypothetical protein
MTEEQVTRIEMRYALEQRDEIEQYLIDLRRHGDIYDYRVVVEDGGICVIVDLTSEPRLLQRIKVDGERYKAQIDAIVSKLR